MYSDREVYWACAGKNSIVQHVQFNTFVNDVQVCACWLLMVYEGMCLWCAFWVCVCMCVLGKSRVYCIVSVSVIVNGFLSCNVKKLQIRRFLLGSSLLPVETATAAVQTTETTTKAIAGIENVCPTFSWTIHCHPHLQLSSSHFLVKSHLYLPRHLAVSADIFQL